MLSTGNASYYVIGSSKYYSDQEYQAAVVRKGKVSISSKPTYCKIFVDGVDTGKLTTETLELIEGTYMIGCAKEGYRAESRVITIIKDITIEERFELTASALGEEEVEVEAKEDIYRYYWRIPETQEIRIVEGTRAGDDWVMGFLRYIIRDRAGKEWLIDPKEIEKTEFVETVTFEEAAKKVAFKIYFTSTPANAKLYIDNVYTHHWTPSNEKELSDVLNLLTVGKHIIKVTKAGMMAEKEITVVDGDNGTINLDLETVGLPAPVEEVKPTVPLDVAAKIAEIERLVKELKDFVGL